MENNTISLEEAQKHVDFGKHHNAFSKYQNIYDAIGNLEPNGGSVFRLKRDEGLNSRSFICNLRYRLKPKKFKVRSDSEYYYIMRVL